MEVSSRSCPAAQALLNERRVVITATDVSALSAAVHAAAAMLYPLQWQVRVAVNSCKTNPSPTFCCLYPAAYRTAVPCL